MAYYYSHVVELLQQLNQPGTTIQSTATSTSRPASDVELLLVPCCCADDGERVFLRGTTSKDDQQRKGSNQTKSKVDYVNI